MDVDRRKSSLCSWEHESDVRDCCFPACREAESMEAISSSVSAFNKDREKRSLCSWDSDSSVRDCGCLPCEDAKGHTRICTSRWSITQITQVPLCPHLQLCSVHGQKICLSSWDTDSRISDCSSPKVVPSACQAKTLGRNLILDNIIMHKESLRPILPHTLTKGLSSIQFSFTYSIPHLPKRSSLPHFGKRNVFLCLPNLGEIYFTELPLAFFLSWPFANLSAEKQPSWLYRIDGDKVTSNVPFLGHSLLQQHQTCLQSANLGRTLQSKRCPVALSRLMQCHS